MHTLQWTWLGQTVAALHKFTVTRGHYILVYYVLAHITLNHDKSQHETQVWQNVTTHLPLQGRCGGIGRAGHSTHF